MVVTNLDGWREYGNDPEARFHLMRHTSRRARWYDRRTGNWVGPEQSNVAPAVAWALHVGIERINGKVETL